MRADLACYRAVLPVAGRVLGVVSSEHNGDYALPAVEILLDSAVATVVKATVNEVVSPVVELVGRDRVLVTVPSTVSALDPRLWVVRVYAEAEFTNLAGAPVPATIGFGPRVTLVDGPMEAMQRAVRELLMDAGPDGRGGGLRRMKGILVNPSDLSPIARDVQIAVDAYNRYNSRTRAQSRAGSWRVTRVEMLSIRVLTPLQALAEFSLPSSETSGTRVLNSGAMSPTETVLAVSLGHELRGPAGITQRASSALAL